MPLFPTMYYVHKHTEYLRFEVLTMVTTKTVVFWGVTVCNLIRTFFNICYVHQIEKISSTRIHDITYQ